MPEHGSVTRLIAPLKAGDPQAAHRLWELYFHRLVGLARRKLQGRRPATGDEEDAALSAFDSLCRGAARGRFPLLADREGLWRLVVLITARKASDLLRAERARKRGGGAVLGESGVAGSPEGQAGLDALPAEGPTPAFAAQLEEEYQRLLDRLDDPDLRTVAVWRMEGHTAEEIADRLGCVVRTVERKLRLIRSLWGEEAQP